MSKSKMRFSYFIVFFCMMSLLLGGVITSGCTEPTPQSEKKTENGPETDGQTQKETEPKPDQTDPGCKGDEECPPGQSCKDKKCVEGQTDVKVSRIEIVSGPAVLREGGTGQLEAVAFNKSDARLNDVKFTWKSSADGTVKIDANGMVTGGSTDGTADITAEVDGVKSDAFKIRNFAALSGDKVRVLVVDETGTAIAGATVKVADKEGKTDANGVVSLDTKPPFDVHVFSKEHTYFSALDVNKKDIYVQVSKNTDQTKAGGTVGSFDFALVTKKMGATDKDGQPRGVGFGLAGLSLPGSLTDLDFTVLLGEMMKKKVANLQEATLPSALFINMNDAPEKYRVLGKKGKRILWGMGGKFSLTRLIDLIGDGLTDPSKINPADIIAKAGPLLKELFFGLARSEVDVKLVARIADKDDINDNGDKTDLIPDFEKMPTNHIVLSGNMDQVIDVKLPERPKNKGNVKLYALGLAGVFVPGRGLVPVGLAIGSDSETSLKISHPKLSGILTKGKFVVGALYVSLPMGDPAPPLLISAGFKVSDTPPKSVTLDKFLAFGENGKYDKDKKELSGAKVDGADAHQLEISSAKGRWVVFYKDKASIKLPAVPAGFDDRLKADDVSSVSLRPLKFKAGVTLDTILEFNSDNLDRINYVISGFSNVYAYEKK